MAIRNSRTSWSWAAISYYLCHWRLSRRTWPPEQATLTERVIRSRLRTPLTTPSLALSGYSEREETASLSCRRTRIDEGANRLPFLVCLTYFYYSTLCKICQSEDSFKFKKDCQLDNPVKIRYNNSVRRTSRRFAPCRLRNSRHVLESVGGYFLLFMLSAIIQVSMAT